MISLLCGAVAIASFRAPYNYDYTRGGNGVNEKNVCDGYFFMVDAGVWR